MTTRKPEEPADQEAAVEEAPKQRTLASAVHVDGQWYYAGDQVPAAVAKQINNESVWATE